MLESIAQLQVHMDPLIITVRGKVIFSQARVKNSVQGGVYPSMHGGRHPLPPGQTPPRPADGYCSGRYASYWNAFLLQYISEKQ